MMLQLKRAGKLKKLKGLIVGGFTDNKDTERTFGKTAYEIIAEAVQEYNYPKCFGFPISHEKENVAIAIGQTYQLEINEDAVSLFRI
jgi:muramoyltetrapeptide carboxypeptidase